MRLLLLLCTVCCCLVARAAEPPPIASFFSNATLSGVQLSPDGRALALKVSGKDGRDRLAVFDMVSGASAIVAQFADVDVGHVEWVNNERLIFDTVDKAIAVGETRYGPGLYAVNRDGSAYRQLAERSNHFIRGPEMRELLPWHTFLLLQRGAQNSDYVYVANYNVGNKGVVAETTLLRLNTLTGRATGVPGPSHALRWLLDQQGEPRMAQVLVDGVVSWHYRTGEQWAPLGSFDAYKGGPGAFSPLGFGPDGSLYMRANKERDTSALYRYDLAAKTVEPAPLVAVRDFDFNGRLIVNKDKLLGVLVQSDALATVWFDDAMKALQARVDKLAPNTINLIAPPTQGASPWVLVTSYADAQPSRYFAFNSATGAITRIGESHPEVKAAQMGALDIVRYKARDGLTIPAWLTLPRGATRTAKLPMVVLVHDGPFAHTRQWGWHGPSQFLASRGYAVLEPEFRGSTGFGYAHFRAGWKQWGLGMQNDLADGARWAIAEGIADPARICIMGAGYGGYAALMGLINDPDLFKCGIDYGGMSDIGLLYSGTWWRGSDVPEDYKRYGMPELVGDPEHDAGQLKASSPLALAAHLRQPLLMAYGTADHRVATYHGKRLAEALEGVNKDAELVLYDDEGATLTVPKNRLDYWGRVEKFLNRHIGTKE